MEFPSNEDQPWSLKMTEVREARLALINGLHIKPLTDFVEHIRWETGYGEGIPYFDPLDGGINARCLFIFEAPGPKAVNSGFISRNNPDNSAKNFFELNKEAGLPRQATISWNIVPWYIGSGIKIRPALDADIMEGKVYLAELFLLLPHLSIVVLAGNKAKKAEEFILKQLPTVEIVTMMHTSPLVINTKKENRGKILQKLRYVAEQLKNAEI